MILIRFTGESRFELQARVAQRGLNPITFERYSIRISRIMDFNIVAPGFKASNRPISVLDAKSDVNLRPVTHIIRAISNRPSLPHSQILSRTEWAMGVLDVTSGGGQARSTIRKIGVPLHSMGKWPGS